MNVYDQAHSLATAVKESEEYKQFQARKRILKEIRSWKKR